MRLKFLGQNTKKQNDIRDRSENEEIYEDLTPKNDVNHVDKDGIYSKAINWALKNNEIKNIALTGPYGSGKSSIIKTFVAKHGGKNKFLNISLATFKNEEGQNENLLEKSILQQMIYKVKNSIIPYSRFKRIKSYTKLSLILYLSMFIFLIPSGLFIYKPELIKGFFKNTIIIQSIKNGNVVNIFLMVILVALFLYCFFFLMTKVQSFIGKNVNFNKISFSKMTIELDKGSESSIFHKYIDEILYFFEVTRYNIVVFEDLDRFNNIDIFESLRELNSLINNSEQINRRVVFMYAIKDDMFGKEDDMFSSRNRTKFFDFIIPVIPIINSSNSGEILIKKLKSSSVGEDISDDFINDITSYIDDMRILINICNEYITYKEKLGGIDLISNNLLAIIIYKNIFPVDFARLQFNEGMVYQVLQRKNDLLEKKIFDIEKNCSEIEIKLKLIDKESLNTINELMVVYAAGLDRGTQNQNQYQNFFIEIDSTRFDYSRSLDSGFFELLRTAKNISYQLLQGQRGNSKEDIATIFNTKVSYFEREKIIKLKEQQQVDSLMKELEILRKVKEEVWAWSLKEVINRSNFDDVFVGEIKDKKLLIFLIRNGYVDEMYQQYITYFYPGSLTTEDMKFIMSVKDQEAMPHNYKLTRTEEIIKRLHGNEFKRPEVLNYDLLDKIIEKGHQNYFDSIILQIVDESETSVAFIDSYKEISNNKGFFIASLCREWHNIWNFIELKSNFSKDKKDDYLSDIIKYAALDDVISMNKNSILLNCIARRDNFFRLFSDEKYYTKLKEVLIKLEVKFDNIDKITIKNDLLDFVYEYDLYKINIEMISLIMDGSNDDSLKYSSIMNSDHNFLIKYVNQNIQEYVENVFLKLKKNNETENIITVLLNDKGISIENRKSIIRKQEAIITDITSVTIEELWGQIISENKTKVNWSNVLHYYQYVGDIDQNLISFLNYEKNSIELSKNKLQDIINFEGDTLQRLTRGIIECNEIKDNCFEFLTQSIHQRDDYDISGLSENRVKIMVLNDILPLTKENYNSIKQNFANLHILLIEKHISTFIEAQNDFKLDPSDINQLINSQGISVQDKNILIKNMDLKMISIHNKLAESISIHLLLHLVDFSTELLDSLFASNVAEDQKIELLNRKIKSLDNETITSLIYKLKAPFSDIAEHRKRPLLVDNNSNRTLINELQEKNYISSWSKEADKLRINTRQK